MSEIERRIADNLDRVRDRIAAAAQRSGRTAEDVTLVAVTKYVDVPEIRALLEAGCRQLGESRPQELWRKAEAMPASEIDWHLIGHLQRNKIRRTLPRVALFQSVDSLRLLEAIDREAAEQERTAEILLEVNVSGQSAKHGFAPEQLGASLEQLPRFCHVRLRGLMCMARLEPGSANARRDFAQLRALRERWRANLPDGVSIDELSMGMSGDFEDAILEGATIVRIGTALYEGLS